MWTLFFPGTPVPKGRPRFGRRQDGTPVTYTPRRTKQAEVDFFAMWTSAHGRLKLTQPVAVTVGVIGSDADVDNLAKQCLDALQFSQAIINDRQVMSLFTYKYTCEEVDATRYKGTRGVHVILETMEESQAVSRAPWLETILTIWRDDLVPGSENIRERKQRDTVQRRRLQQAAVDDLTSKRKRQGGVVRKTTRTRQRQV